MKRSSRKPRERSSGEEETHYEMEIPTDTLATSSKSKSLQGRNRELRFICEQKKRILESERHSVKVKFEKEKMLFKKHAMRMLEKPRKHFVWLPDGEELKADEDVDDDVDGADKDKMDGDIIEELPRLHLGHSEQLKPQLASNIDPHYLDSQPQNKLVRGRMLSARTIEANRLLEEMKDSNARVNKGKKTCSSAPLACKNIRSDPLYKLSSRLPKLEAVFSELIKEHNGLRRRKVEYKIKDFLERLDRFNKEQKQCAARKCSLRHEVSQQSLSKCQNPEMDNETFEDSISIIYYKNLKSQPSSIEGGSIPSIDYKTLKSQSSSIEGSVLAIDYKKLKSHSSINAARNEKIPIPTLMSIKQRSFSHNSKPDQCSSSHKIHYPDDVFEALSLADNISKARQGISLSFIKPKKPQLPKIELEKTKMLKVWEDFTEDMSVEAMQRLVIFAAKNKLDLANDFNVVRPTSGNAASQFISNFKSASVFENFLGSLSSLDGDQQKDFA